MALRLLRPLALLLVLAPLPPAPAQMSLDTAAQFTTNVALGQVMPAAIEAAYGRSGRRRGSKKSAPSVATSRARLGYVRSVARREKTLAAFVEGYRKRSPAAAREIESLFAQNPVEPTVRRGVAKYGLSTANLADMTAMYLASAWSIARGHSSDPSSSQVRGLRDQLARAYVATPGIVRSSDAAKQQLADVLMAQALVDNAMFMSAKGDPARTRRVCSNTAQSVKTAFRLDLSRYALTPQGFTPK